eukprot:CAMPEP_0196721628 /NCGR_PEP_ID=MMETSP1091-20130531/4133_1 /TAXON_ID=302021 /ORGANISM="Rhodomonas sp., Strain CCMP768" /LENGTH=146 /DNA_ID=CAMNT_0042063131 /DNA_START=197 /DNA_END=632 /DNA_ORIENTATION=-
MPAYGPGHGERSRAMLRAAGPGPGPRSASATQCAVVRVLRVGGHGQRLSWWSLSMAIIEAMAAGPSISPAYTSPQHLIKAHAVLDLDAVLAAERQLHLRVDHQIRVHTVFGVCVLRDPLRTQRHPRAAIQPGLGPELASRRLQQIS